MNKPVPAGHQRKSSSALVTRVTRRELQLRANDLSLSGKASTQALEVSVGDYVEYEMRAELAFVTKVMPRRNALSRVYRDSTKILAANIDLVIVVAGAEPLFQPLFIDRVLTVCHQQGIACSLVVNKRDLGLDSIGPLLEVYQRLHLPVASCSAKYSQGIDQIEQWLCATHLKTVVITGISGVGKSTLLNNLIPEAKRETREVSSKTGLGRQTTSQAQGFMYSRARERAPILLVDLPGLQNFGVSHLSHFEVASAFPEIVEARPGCKFSDCLHRAEVECAVKAAFARGEIAEFRYHSYLKMLEEIDQAAPY